jgi:DNA (cytosine-5)-methyltransferase 1
VRKELSLKHGSLFSGIGGFDLASQWMGWENVFQVEWNNWCQKVLTKNFPDALRFGDIVEFNNMLENGEIITDTKCGGLYTTESITRSVERPNGESITTDKRRTQEVQTINLGRIDIITGGFPCQPFSHAGKRKGISDERYLWSEMLRTIRILKPSFVVGENVAGLVSMDDGKTLDSILSDLENEGYYVESFIIPACAVGAWHRRDRIWIVAYTTSGRCKIRNELQNGFPLRRTNRTNIEYGKEYWYIEPPVGRMANGIPNRVDRLKGLGNAIVPQVAFEIFKAIEAVSFQETYKTKQYDTDK